MERFEVEGYGKEAYLLRILIQVLGKRSTKVCVGSVPSSIRRRSSGRWKAAYCWMFAIWRLDRARTRGGPLWHLHSGTLDNFVLNNTAYQKTDDLDPR